MCNLYAASASRAAVMKRFGLKDNRTAHFEPKTAIFPGREAPVILLNEDGERELQLLTWGYVRRPPGRAPSRTGNARNDTVLSNRFWTDSFKNRRALVPATAYCEPVGQKPAVWHWHALHAQEPRTLFAFPGIWRDYTGPIKKDGEPVTQRVFAFLTCGPNALPTAEHHGRMPVVLDNEEAFERWMKASPEEALGLAKPYPAEGLVIVQSGNEKHDMLLDAA